MDKETLVKDLKQILIEDLFVSLAPDEIKLEDSLANDLGVDSVGFVELVAILEEKHGIKISDEEAKSGNLRSLDRLSSFILAKTAGKQGERVVSESHG